MRRRLWQTIGLIAALVTLACGSALSAEASADSAGTVHFVRSADSEFDGFTSNPSAQAQAWLRAHIWRMTVFSPYFDANSGWYPQGWVYDDAYAIYKGSQLALAHPDWILKDSAGNDLYIPFGCSGGSCPQYAGDISNPAYRRYWIEEAKARLAHGYRGLFVDDVNLEERTGNGAGQQLAPIDPSNGQPIDAARWRSYMAQFMAEVRAAAPSAEIVHNAIWFADGSAGSSDPSIRQEIESANYILLERGVNDSGLTGGNGQWSLNAFFSYIDEVHSLGRGVVIDGSASDPSGMEYNLASYFLISTGNDAVSAGGQTPVNWWSGWDVSLGEATAGRYTWENVLRRDFTGGMALVNPPGSPAQTIALPNAMRETSGESVTSVTLQPASGIVLRGNPSTAPGAAAPPAPTPAKASSTQTTVETRPAGGASTPAVPTPQGAARGARGHGDPRPRSRRRRRRVGHAHSHKRARRGAHQASLGRTGHEHREVLSRISGHVRLATQGTVAIEIDRRRGSRWVLVDRVSVGVSQRGRFTRLLDLRAGLPYRVRAVYLGASRFRPSRSRYRVVVMRARMRAR